MDGNGGTDRGGVDVGAVITVAFCLSIFSLRGVFDELFVDTSITLAAVVL